MENVTSITNDFQISIISKYIPEQSNLEIPIFFFGYWITITNLSQNTAKLINRYWHITDADGRINEVHGKGIVGKQPSIEPNESFEYNSFCPLPTKFGFMKGYYEMVNEKNKEFKIIIPQFCLSCPNSAN